MTDCVEADAPQRFCDESEEAEPADAVVLHRDTIDRAAPQLAVDELVGTAAAAAEEFKAKPEPANSDLRRAERFADANAIRLFIPPATNHTPKIHHYDCRQTRCLSLLTLRVVLRAALT